MKQIVTVTGMRAFNDTVDGTKHDFTKLVVEMDYPDKPTHAGKMGQEINWGDSSNFAKLGGKDFHFPAQFEVDFNLTTKGYEIVSAAPVARPQLATKAG